MFRDFLFFVVFVVCFIATMLVIKFVTRRAALRWAEVYLQKFAKQNKSINLNEYHYCPVKIDSSESKVLWASEACRGCRKKS